MKTICVLGDRNPAFVTHRGVDAVCGLISGVDLRWVGTDTVDAGRTASADGLWVVPGSPYRDDAAVYAAIQHARTSGQPFLATCGGFQYAVVEFARHVAGIEDAEHAETAPSARQHVINRLACSLVGQERMVTAVPVPPCMRCAALHHLSGSIGAITASHRCVSIASLIMA